MDLLQQASTQLLFLYPKILEVWGGNKHHINLMKEWVKRLIYMMMRHNSTRHCFLSSRLQWMKTLVHLFITVEHNRMGSRIIQHAPHPTMKFVGVDWLNYLYMLHNALDGFSAVNWKLT